MPTCAHVCWGLRFAHDPGRREKLNVTIEGVQLLASLPSLTLHGRRRAPSCPPLMSRTPMRLHAVSNDDERLIKYTYQYNH